MLQIEWQSSHYHSDGRRRSRPKPSTVHGWLVKWRATFSGNERLRKEGIREMREAKAARERKKQQKAARRAKARTSKHFFRLWPISLGKKKQRPQAPKGSSRSTQHPSPKRQSRGNSRSATFSAQSPKPTPVGRGRRSGHNRQQALGGDRKQHDSRKASHDNRGSVARIAKKR